MPPEMPQKSPPSLPQKPYTLDSVQTMPHVPNRPMRQSIALYRRIVTVFLVLTVLVAVMVAYVVLSRASIVILSKQDSANADFIVDVATKPSANEVAGTVLQAEDSLTETFPSSSVIKIDAPAEGKVKISSTLFRPQTLIATTRLLTPDGVLFRLKKTVVVPAGGSVVADVHADQPGASGNVAGVTFAIPGLNAETARFFTVTTVDSIEGGVKDQHMLTKEDIATAAEALGTKLKGSLADALRQKAKDAGVQTGGEFISYDVVRQSTNVPVGDEGTQFSLTLDLKATGVFYDAKAFADRVNANITDHLPYGRGLLSVEDGSVTTEVEKVDLVANRANLHVTAKGTTVLSPDSPALRKEKLLGVTADAAKKYLERIDGVSSASVRVTPFWIGRLPNVPEHITIEVR